MGWATGENPLSSLRPRLRELAAEHDGSTAGLEQVPGAWGSTCRDALQRGVQDAHDPSTREAWALTVGRVDAWMYLVRTGQWRFASPVRVHTPDYRFRLR